MARQSEDHRCDVLIIGGGFSGCLLAGRLAALGLRVFIVTKELDGLIYDQRLIALTLRTRALFEKWDVWPFLEKFISPVKEIFVRYGARSFSVRNSFGQKGEEAAFMVPAQQLDEGIRCWIEQRENVNWIAGMDILSVKQNATTVTICVGTDKGNVAIAAPLIVGADGNRGEACAIWNIPQRKWSYGQKALVFFCKHQNSHRFSAFEVFHKQWVVGILPTQNEHRSSIVLSVNAQSEMLGKRLVAEIPDFLAENCPFLGEVQVCSAPDVYSLVGKFSSHPVGKRFCAIGDAWHVIHPLAGQGLNMGVADIDCLSKKIAAHKKIGLDIGGVDLLDSYAKFQKNYHVKRFAFMQAVTGLFSGQSKREKVFEQAFQCVQEKSFLKDFLFYQGIET